MARNGEKVDHGPGFSDDPRENVERAREFVDEMNRRHGKKQPRRKSDREEEHQQVALAKWLDWNSVTWCHVPNGGRRTKVEAARFKLQGVKPGVPDVLIFDAPPIIMRRAHAVGRTTLGAVRELSLFDERLRGVEVGGYRLIDIVQSEHMPRGVAIELKRRKGGVTSDEQALWIEKLRDRGWIAFVADGADAAIADLRKLGFGDRGALG